MEVARWPVIRNPKIDRCGSGDTIGDGTEGPVLCGRCIFWHRPDGKGLEPDYRQGLNREWWADSGYCVRFAPSPSNEEERVTWWRVVNATDSCGDGEEVKRNEDD